MPELKIAIETLSLRQPFKKALQTAAQLGAAAVEIDVRNELRVEEFSQTALRQLRKMLEDLNLKVSAVTFPTRGGYDESRDLDRRLAATRSAMKFAYEVGARVVVNQIGQVPDDPPNPQGDFPPGDLPEENLPQGDLLIESLMNLSDYGQRVGAFFAVRTGNGSAEHLARLIDRLPEESLGVSLDPGALIVQGETPQDAISILGRRILHVHANDAVRDLSPGRATEVTLGRGSADFPALLGALEEFNYRGWFTIERRDGDNPIGEIGDAVKYLRSL